MQDANYVFGWLISGSFFMSRNDATAQSVVELGDGLFFSDAVVLGMLCYKAHVNIPSTQKKRKMKTYPF